MIHDRDDPKNLTIDSIQDAVRESPNKLATDCASHKWRAEWVGDD